MKKISLFIFSIFLVGNVFASGLLPDLLIYKNDTINIQYGLFENYVENYKLRIDIIDFFGGFNTACKRGYIAVWELRNDSLFLKSVRSCNDSKVTLNLDKTFAEKYINNEVFADWDNESFTYNSFGEIIAYQSWSSTTAFYKIFHFEKGILKSIKNYDDRSDPTYSENFVNKFLYENINWILINNYLDSNKSLWANFQINSEGKPMNIIIDTKYSIDKVIDKEIVRVLSIMPQDSYPHEIDNTWRMEIYLNKESYEKK